MDEDRMDEENGGGGGDASPKRTLPYVVMDRIDVDLERDHMPGVEPNASRWCRASVIVAAALRRNASLRILMSHICLVQEVREKLDCLRDGIIPIGDLERYAWVSYLDWMDYLLAKDAQINLADGRTHTRS